MLPTKFRFILPSGLRGEDLKKSANQKQELHVVARFVNGSGQNVQSLERTIYRCFLRRLKFIPSQFPLSMALNSVFSFIKMSDRDLKFV
jgi:hypothetical protein